MARHHYVPQFVLRRFVSDRAWTLVPSEKREIVRELDQRLLARPPDGQSPVCVLRKSTSIHSGTVERSILRATCSMRGLYAVRTYDDPVLRGVLRQNLAFISGTSSHLGTLQEYRELGEEPIDPETVERVHAGLMDARFGKLANRLVSGGELSPGDWDALRPCLSFARHRTVAWRDGYHRTVALRNVRRATDRVPVGENHTVGSLMRVFHDNLWASGPALSAGGRVDPLTKYGLRVALLRAPATSRFVASDNPMRQFLIDDLQRHQIPGFRDDRTVATYVLGPDHCLFVTRNPRVAHGSTCTISDDQVRRINTATLLHAYLEVVLPGPSLEGLFESWVDPWRVRRPRRL